MTLINEKDIENIVIEKLKINKWKPSLGKEKNVYQQNARTKEEQKLLGRKKPDFILYDIKSYDPLAIIETKKPGENLQKALEQGCKYAKQLNIKIVFAFDGFTMRSLHIPTNKELIFGGTNITDFPPYNILIKFVNNNKVDLNFGKKITSEKQFIKEMTEIENMLRKEGLKAGDERFTEFSKLLFLKLISSKENNAYIWETIKDKKKNEIIQMINSHLSDFNKKFNMNKYGEKLKIKSPDIIKNMVNRLSNIDFVNTNLDVKGSAFEYFLNYKGKNDDLAQYFTPREIVRFLIELSNPKPFETLYDPFCGSGGILIKAFDHIKNQIINNEKHLKFLKEKQLWGTDISTIAYVAKMNMILVGDGHTNIIRQTDGSLVNRRKEKYDIVITNIPFNLPINASVEGIMYNIHSSNGNSIAIQHVLDSLKKQMGSRAAIIVPEQVIFAKDLIETRKFLIDNYNVKVFSLPQGVFSPYTIAKTCILYLEYKGSKGKISYLEIKNVGFTPNRSKIPIGKNDLIEYISNMKSPMKIWNKNEIKLEYSKLEKNDFKFKPITLFAMGTKLSEILIPIKTKAKLMHNKQYNEITVKINGKGVVKRIYNKANNISTKWGSELLNRNLITSDAQYIISTLDVRNGGFGKIPKELIGSVYTNTYHCFKVDDNFKNINLDFLTKLLCTEEMLIYFTSISKGTTNRRPVKKEEFLNTILPYDKTSLLEMNKKYQKIANKILQHKEILRHLNNSLITITNSKSIKIKSNCE